MPPLPKQKVKHGNNQGYRPGGRSYVFWYPGVRDHWDIDLGYPDAVHGSKYRNIQGRAETGFSEEMMIIKRQTVRQMLTDAIDAENRLNFGKETILVEAATRYRDSLSPDPVERTIVRWYLEIHYENETMDLYSYPTREQAEAALTRLEGEVARRARITGPHEHEVMP
jgi:hypothetical protein